MKNKWHALSSREQKMIVFGGIFVLIFVLYVWVFAPLNARIAAANDTWQQQKNTLTFVSQTITRIQRLQQKGYRLPAQKVALLSTTEQVLSQHRLQPYLSKIAQPEPNTLTLNFDLVPFDGLISALKTLQFQHGIYVKQARIQKTDTPGLTRATVTLEGVK